MTERISKGQQEEGKQKAREDRQKVEGVAVGGGAVV